MKNNKNIFIGLISIGVIILTVIIYLININKSYDNWVDYILDQKILYSSINYETKGELTNCNSITNCISEDNYNLTKAELTDILVQYKDASFEEKWICSIDRLTYPYLSIMYNKNGEDYYLTITPNSFESYDDTLTELLPYEEVAYDEPDCDSSTYLIVPGFDISKSLNKFIK